MPAFKDQAFQAWKRKYGHPPPWMTKDYAILAKALKACGDAETAKQAWYIYLACDEPFFQGHEPAKFVRFLSRWVAMIPRPKPQPEADFGMEARAKLLGEIAREMAGQPESAIRQEYMRRSKNLLDTPLEL